MPEPQATSEGAMRRLSEDPTYPTRIIVWFQGKDLRIHDNPLLSTAMAYPRQPRTWPSVMDVVILAAARATRQPALWHPDTWPRSSASIHQLHSSPQRPAAVVVGVGRRRLSAIAPAMRSGCSADARRPLRSPKEVVPVFIFDPARFEETNFGSVQTGAIRANFLIEAVRRLKPND